MKIFDSGYLHSKKNISIISHFETSENAAFLSALEVFTASLGIRANCFPAYRQSNILFFFYDPTRVIYDLILIYIFDIFFYYLSLFCRLFTYISLDYFLQAYFLEVVCRVNEKKVIIS
jgi:hypothetical protein